MPINQGVTTSNLERFLANKLKNAVKDEIWPAVSGSLKEDKILTATAQAESFETAEVVVVEGGGLVLDETATFDTGKTTFGMHVQLVLQIRDAAAIIKTGADGAGMVQLLADARKRSNKCAS